MNRHAGVMMTPAVRIHHLTVISILLRIFSP